jgi:hypothetical protein
MPDRISTLPPALEALAERYLDVPRVCFLCREAPATTPLVFVADATVDAGVCGCVFGVCMVCLCSDDFQARVCMALRQDQREREAAPWN